MFNNKQLMTVNTAVGSTLFFYTSTDDNTSTITTDGYFNNTVDTKSARASQIKQGDVIIVRGSDNTTATVCVNSATGVTPLTVV